MPKSKRPQESEDWGLTPWWLLSLYDLAALSLILEREYPWYKYLQMAGPWTLGRILGGAIYSKSPGAGSILDVLGAAGSIAGSIPIIRQAKRDRERERKEAEKRIQKRFEEMRREQDIRRFGHPIKFEYKKKK